MPLARKGEARLQAQSCRIVSHRIPGRKKRARPSPTLSEDGFPGSSREQPSRSGSRETPPRCCSPALLPQGQVGGADLSTCWRRAWLGSSGGSRGSGPSGRTGSNGASSRAGADHLLAAGPGTALDPKQHSLVSSQGEGRDPCSRPALPLPCKGTGLGHKPLPGLPPSFGALSKLLSEPTAAGPEEQLALESLAHRLLGEASAPTQMHQTAAGDSPASKEAKMLHGPQTAAPSPLPSPTSLLLQGSLQGRTGQR